MALSDEKLSFQSPFVTLPPTADGISNVKTGGVVTHLFDAVAYLVGALGDTFEPSICFLQYPVQG